MTPVSPAAASAAGSLFAGVPIATGGSEPWQWLFFAALGAWLVGGAGRPAVSAAGGEAPARDVPPATDAGRWYLMAVGAVLLLCTLAACWRAVAAG